MVVWSRRHFQCAAQLQMGCRGLLNAGQVVTYGSRTSRSNCLAAHRVHIPVAGTVKVAATPGSYSRAAAKRSIDKKQQGDCC